MNKKMRELMAQIQAKTVEAKSFMEGENKDVNKANELLDQVEALKAEYETEKRLYEMEKENNTPDPEAFQAQKEAKVEKDSIAKFADDARNGFKANKAMNEGTSADGGYTVPEDIQTRITNYRDSKASLLHLVTVEKVSTNKGQRTFKKRSQQTGFTKVGEGGKIGAKNTPQFERIGYEIDKYAGYFPVTNELLADSDANIANTLIEFIGDESRVTANKLILEQIATVAQTALNGLDDIKKALNVTLGSAFKATSKIVTNDDGLQYLDTLKDEKGNYLLQPSPADPMKLVLCAGATSVPVEVLPNADMPSDTTTSAGNTRIPFVIGDLKEAVVYWDRQQMTISVSNIAQVGDLNAFEEDLTIYRAIEREDVTTRDTQAIVNGYIEVVGE
jgi:HK97 family phage major capsid protein